MNAGMTFNQRDIVLMPFPFTDLSDKKNRPALILSNQEFNTKNKDIICCVITSNPRDYAKSIEIDNKDLETGYLLKGSKIKPNKIFTLSKNKIIKKLAILNLTKTKEAIKNLYSFLE